MDLMNWPQKEEDARLLLDQAGVNALDKELIITYLYRKVQVTVEKSPSLRDVSKMPVAKGLSHAQISTRINLATKLTEDFLKKQRHLS